MKNIYGKSNNYKTKEDRLSVIAIYRRKLLQLLKAGFNPFVDNTALYEKRTIKEGNQSVAQETTIPVIEEPKMTLKEAFDLGFKSK